MIDKFVVDPFVEISLHVPEWTSSQFLLEPTKAAGIVSSSASGATANAASSARTLSVHTTVVKNNGFNPRWRESFSIPFDCVGNMKELIFVEFVARHHNGDLLGMYCTPLSCVAQGLFKLPLILFVSDTNVQATVIFLYMTPCFLRFYFQLFLSRST